MKNPLKKILIFNQRLIAILCWFPAIHQHGSAIGIHMSPPSHLPPQPSPLGGHRALVCIPWVKQQIPVGYPILHVLVHMFPWSCFYSSRPLLPAPSTLSKSLFSMSASPLLPYINRFISTIFLDFHIYVFICNIFVFIFLTYSTLYNRL